MAFEDKFEARDSFVRKTRQRHGIADLASQADMEATVRKLLAGRGSDIDDAITLAMNRRVDAQDDVMKDLFWLKTTIMSADDKYAILLMCAPPVN